MSGRPMKFPYTLSAKIAQFPYQTYFTHKEGWVLRYWVVSAILCMPLWYYFTNLSYNPANVKKWAEIDRKQFSGEMQHH